MENDKKSLEDLESAINSIPKPEKAISMTPTEENVEQPKMNSDQEIGFHKGALTTLINERNELVKMVANVEKVMNAHVNRLKELGVEVK